LGWVIILLLGLGQPPLELENLPKNHKFSIFFPSGQKNLIGLDKKTQVKAQDHPLIYCGGSESCPG